MSRLLDFSRLVQAWDELGPDERRVVALVAERLAAGRADYGRLNVAADPRSFAGEAAEELIDAVAYIAMSALRRVHNPTGDP